MVKIPSNILQKNMKYDPIANLTTYIKTYQLPYSWNEDVLYHIPFLQYKPDHF